MNKQDRLEWSLLALRAGVFLVMFMWTLDKFVNPDHQVRIFEHFYFIPGLSEAIVPLMGAAEMVLLAAFLLGVQKRISYGLVLLFHSVSTFSSFGVYLNPWEGSALLFFAAWPMWSACLALYLLRDFDRKLTIDSIVGRKMQQEAA